MQEVIEEILRTEEDCAQRLDDVRRQSEKRRTEIESGHAERVRSFRQEQEKEASRLIAAYQTRIREESEDSIGRAREASERDFAVNQAVLDRIVDRIVELVVRVER